MPQHLDYHLADIAYAVALLRRSMRKFVLILVMIAVACAGYLGSAIFGLWALATAVKQRDAPEIAQRTDFRAVRDSIVRQLVAAYLQQRSQAKKIRRVDELVANTAGASMADAMLAKYLTPSSLAILLSEGRMPATSDYPEIIISQSQEFSAQNLLSAASGIRPIGPMSFSVRLSRDEAEYYGVRLGFYGDGWRLAGVDLPVSSLRELAIKLPQP
jgi:hypothetical protein